MSVQDRVINIPSSSKTAAGKHGARPTEQGRRPVLLGLIALAVIVIACGSTVATTMRNYLHLFPPSNAMASQTELQRFALTGWQNAMLTSAAPSIIPDGELTLVGRQAEFAFYVRKPQLFFAEPEIAPLFERATAEDAHRALRERGVRWVFMPDYALPEFTETHMSDMLANPDLAQFSVSYQGYTLYRLYDQPLALPVQLLKRRDFRLPAGAQTDWVGLSTTSSGAQPITTMAVADHPADGIRVRTVRDPAFARNAYSVIQRAGASPFASPQDLGDSDIPAAQGSVRVSAEISGRGNIEMRIRTWRQGSGIIEERMLWKGALLGEERTISGQYLDFGEAVDRYGEATHINQLQFILTGPGELTVHGWQAELYGSLSNNSNAPREWTMAELGWELGGAVPPPPADQLALARDGDDIVVRQLLNGPINAAAPYALRPSRPGAADLGMGTVLMPTTIFLRGQFSGEGFATLGAAAICDDGRRETITFARVTLSERRSTRRFEALMPCFPRAIQGAVEATPDPGGGAPSVVRIRNLEVGAVLKGGRSDSSSFTYIPATQALERVLDPDADKPPAAPAVPAPSGRP